MADFEDTNFKIRMAAAAVFWQGKRSRITVVRRIVCEIIFETTQPFEANWLLEEARKVDNHISMASVYRTLKGLREAELVEEFFNKSDKSLYQLRPVGQASSACIICKNCGKTIPIDDPCLPIREGAQAHRKGFKVTHVRLQTEATCDEFELNGSCGKGADLS